ncbi:D-alanyl-D-alanine carboxypeptidase [Lachnospiraceae bacterium XBB1006]|nr:D-alanyl-D-alanine carboxypeptidase [Lachnospiraceae bacterium XBB1006]
MKKRIRTMMFAICIFVTLLPTQAMAQNDQSTFYWPKGPKVKADSAIIMEANTGSILYEKKIHKRHYPASITKILTTLLCVENSDLSETVTFSHDSVFTTEGTSIARDEGEKMSMKDTLYAVMLGSANECAYAAAEHVGGTIDHFVEMMNERAKACGCVDSTFHNPHGLPDKKHKTSAYDMAMISKEALKNPDFRKITGTKTYMIPKTNKHKDETFLVNHNEMLTYYHTGRHVYEGCIGGKTGYTNAAGNTLVTYAERNGMTLICVVMKDNAEGQYEDTTKLLDYCFDNFQTYKLNEHDRTYNMEDITKALNFEQVKPYITIDEDSYVVLPKTAEFKQITSKVNRTENEQDSAGTVDYYYGKRLVGSAQITISVDEGDLYSFGDSSDKEEDRFVIKINLTHVFIIVVLLGILGGGVAAAIYLRHNIYVILYSLRRRRQEESYRSLFRRRRRRR